jgi:hypothetical protein
LTEAALNSRVGVGTNAAGRTVLSMISVMAAGSLKRLEGVQTHSDCTAPQTGSA